MRHFYYSTIVGVKNDLKSNLKERPILLIKLENNLDHTPKKKKKTKKKGLYALIKQVVPLIVEPVIYWTIESTRKRFYRKPTCYPKITKLSHLLSYDWRVHITRSQSVRIFITTTMFFRISGYILN